MGKNKDSCFSPNTELPSISSCNSYLKIIHFRKHEDECVLWRDQHGHGRFPWSGCYKHPIPPAGPSSPIKCSSGLWIRSSSLLFWTQTPWAHIVLITEEQRGTQVLRTMKLVWEENDPAQSWLVRLLLQSAKCPRKVECLSPCTRKAGLTQRGNDFSPMGLILQDIRNMFPR